MVERSELGRGGEELLIRVSENFPVAAVCDRRLFGAETAPLQ